MMTRSDVPLLCLAGPTASGKSAIACAIAQRWPTEIINVDSATIYRGMDIGTAKPSRTEQQTIKHHLLDIRDPSESYSAAAFRHDALQCAAEVKARGHMPLKRKQQPLAGPPCIPNSMQSIPSLQHVFLPMTVSVLDAHWKSGASAVNRCLSF
jgi:hypothetical protein